MSDYPADFIVAVVIWLAVVFACGMIVGAEFGNCR